MVKLFCAIAGVAEDAFPVVIDAGETVGDLKKAIQKTTRGEIKGDPDKLKLFLAKMEGGKWLLEKSDVGKKLEDGETTPEVEKMIAENEMMPSWTIQDMLADFKMTGDLAPSSKQIHVLVVLPDQQQSGSTKKHLRCKELTAEDSCRKFLDVLADNLAELYDFDWKDPKRLSMGDVFNAVRNNYWRFRLKRGRHLTDFALPDFFTEEQWLALMHLNLRTNGRIHDGKVARTSEGKPYIILSHAIATRYGIDIFKDIATKARVVRGWGWAIGPNNFIFERAEIEVKVEDELSVDLASFGRHLMS